MAFSVHEPIGRFVPHNMSEALKQIGVDRAAPIENRSLVFAMTRGRVHGWLPSYLTFLCGERLSPIFVGGNFNV